MSAQLTLQHLKLDARASRQNGRDLRQRPAGAAMRLWAPAAPLRGNDATAMCVRKTHAAI
ncbi:hypothetical protein BC360_02085 [Ensifer sp. LC163]|nr:hypothetical protein BC360_02085 [Ensifer sp. LC163]